MEGLTVKDNIIVHYLNEKNVYDDDKDLKIESLLKIFGIENRKEHYPRELSGGEQQRLAIARALIKNPSIIILDEPISNLDENNAKVIIDYIMKYMKNENCITLISCHTNHFDDYVDAIIKL